MMRERGIFSLRRAAAVAALMALPCAVPGAVGFASRFASQADDPPPESPTETAHLYRIVGKVRLLLFWVGADDVGSARTTRRVSDGGHVLSLLIGSEPTRAPRSVNEWGYIREEVAGESATVFGLRTLTDGDSPDAAEARRTAPGGSAEFGVLCSSVSPAGARSRTTTVFTPRDVTYRDVHRALEAAERSVRWTRRETPRPADAAPGFLTALDAMLRATAASAQQGVAGVKSPPAAYVYRDAVFDLTPRRVERVPELDTGKIVLHNLLRSDITLRNRTTGWTTSFAVTYGTEGALAGVPVFARYQPNWWFKVELELEDRGDVPPDPVRNPQMARRVVALCSQAFGR